METSNSSMKKIEKKKRKLKVQNIYTETILSRTCFLDISDIDDNIKKTLEENLIKNIEGKCISEGFIKSDSCRIESYSSGLIYNGNKIKFEVVFKCKICLPVEGMLIDCVVKNITKAGIKAEINEDVSPVIIFVARDHHYSNDEFSKVNENDNITVRVIGQKFELNDKYISVIASLT